VRNYGKHRPSRNTYESDKLGALMIVRPEFTGTLAIKSGRHPILETMQVTGSLIPNDVYCDDSSSFQIIQGPKYVHEYLSFSMR
jgi:dsDNA-specific endonuclease/ATPase MutS2